MSLDLIRTELMADYARRSRAFWRTEFLMVALIGAVIIFPASYFLAQQYRGMPWWRCALDIWLLAMVMPVLVMRPKKPTEHDVEMAGLFQKYRGSSSR